MGQGTAILFVRKYENIFCSSCSLKNYWRKYSEIVQKEALDNEAWEYQYHYT